MDASLRSGWYPLRIVVSIWTALYQAGLRIRTGAPPKVLDVLESPIWNGDMSPAGGIIRKTRERVAKLTGAGCRQTLETLDREWSARAQGPGLMDRGSLDVICLYSLRSFSGAVWDYQELICYVPEFKKVLGFRLRFQDYNILRSELRGATEAGRDPFVGARMRFLNCQVDLTFNRIRRGSQTRIHRESIAWLPSPSEVLDLCGDLFIAPGEFTRTLGGESPLNLSEYTSARFANSIVFFKPCISIGQLEDAEFDGSYKVRLNVSGRPISAEIEDQFCFGPDGSPENLKGKNVAFLALVPVGLSVKQLHEMRLPLVGIVPQSNDFDLVSPVQPEVRVGASISAVTSELHQAFTRPAGPLILQPEEVEADVLESEPTEIEIPAVPEAVTAPKPKAEPYYTPIRGDELEPLHAKLMALLSSDRMKMFPTKELEHRARSEGFRTVAVSEIRRALSELAERELIYMDILGQHWLLNPRVKFIATWARVPLESVGEQVVRLLQKESPRKLSVRQIIGSICRQDNRVTPRLVISAINSAAQSHLVLHDRRMKWYWNPYYVPAKAKGPLLSGPRDQNRVRPLMRPRPAATTVTKESVASEKVELVGGFFLAHLDESMVSKLPYRTRVGSRGVILLRNPGDKGASRLWVRPADSGNRIREAVALLKDGKYQSLEFFDPLNGKVTVFSDARRNLSGIFTSRRRDQVLDTLRKLREG